MNVPAPLPEGAPLLMDIVDLVGSGMVVHACVVKIVRLQVLKIHDVEATLTGFIFARDLSKQNVHSNPKQRHPDSVNHNLGPCGSQGV